MTQPAKVPLKLHVPAPQLHEPEPLASVSFAPLLRAAELMRQREKLEAWSAGYLSGQQHPELPLDEALKRYESKKDR